jgi:hypothetical protein
LLAALTAPRPGKWGNRFIATEKRSPGKSIGGFYIAVPTDQDAVECFRDEMRIRIELDADLMRCHLEALHGKNLACWCNLDEPWCHVDVLLELSALLNCGRSPGPAALTVDD